MITNIIIFVAGMMVMAGMIWVASEFTEPHLDDEVSKEAAEKMLALIREQEKLGRIVLLVLDGEVHSMDLDAVLKQPAEGLLYDLNRNRLTCSVWIAEGERTWVNNYAVALVIKRLMEQKGELVEALKLIAVKCHNFTGTDCWKSGRILGHEYSAESVCDACIATAALVKQTNQVKGKDND